MRYLNVYGILKLNKEWKQLLDNVHIDPAQITEFELLNLKDIKI